SYGIAIGKVFLLENPDFVLNNSDQVLEIEREKEIEKFQLAIEKTKESVRRSYEKINKALGQSYAKIADAHMMMLEDPMMKTSVLKMIEKGSKAEYAVYKTMSNILEAFSKMKDGYFRERSNDIRDLCQELIFNLLGKKRNSLANLPKDSIVVSHNLTAADTALMKEKTAQGFAIDIGGKTSHVALVANGLGIPAVSGLQNVSKNVKTGDTIILDGINGLVIINPDAQTIKKYEAQLQAWLEQKRQLISLAHLPSQTLDGQKVFLLANIDSPDEVKTVLENGAQGIGLYRSEFIYFHRSSWPTPKEHFEAYYKVVTQMQGKPVVIRTVDLGGDKLSNVLIEKIGYEQNPFLGLRAIRLCLKYPDMFEAQLLGLLQASAFGKIDILYPMISGLEQLQQASEILDKAKEKLRAKKIPFDENIKVGAMIEIPAAVMISDALAKHVDFFSIGTNDLIQYSIATDRGNESVADLYNPLHPAILKLIKITIDSANQAKIPVAMCGQMASNPLYTKILLGLGLKEFSVAKEQIPLIKKVIRETKVSDAKELAQKVLACQYQDEILELLSMDEIKESNK
ncbi:MAG: phosphoenolpyruvate--protein phosphotransferase, partial [Elusimicrobiota bacterium]|nr:phosphoenolpyruvate--protein phosphotransferase [Elusimicrobiota bacterium]